MATFNTKTQNPMFSQFLGDIEEVPDDDTKALLAEQSAAADRGWQARLAAEARVGELEAEIATVDRDLARLRLPGANMDDLLQQRAKLKAEQDVLPAVLKEARAQQRATSLAYLRLIHTLSRTYGNKAIESHEQSMRDWGPVVDQVAQREGLGGGMMGPEYQDLVRQKHGLGAQNGYAQELATRARNVNFMADKMIHDFERSR